MKPRDRSVNFSKFMAFSFHKAPDCDVAAPALRHAPISGLGKKMGCATPLFKSSGPEIRRIPIHCRRFTNIH